MLVSPLASFSVSYPRIHVSSHEIHTIVRMHYLRKRRYLSCVGKHVARFHRRCLLPRALPSVWDWYLRLNALRWSISCNGRVPPGYLLFVTKFDLTDKSTHIMLIGLLVIKSILSSGKIIPIYFSYFSYYSYVFSWNNVTELARALPLNLYFRRYYRCCRPEIRSDSRMEAQIGIRRCDGIAWKMS